MQKMAVAIWGGMIEKSTYELYTIWFEI